MISLKVDKKGALFDGRAEAAVTRFTEDATKTLVSVATQMVKLRFGSRIRVNTGYFLGRITGEVTGSIGRVYTKFLLYGYWLEGVGSQNQTTRFKGYWGYRDTFIEVDANSKQILKPLIEKLTREMGAS